MGFQCCKIASNVSLRACMLVSIGNAGKGRKGNSQPIPVKVGDVLKEAKVQSLLGWGAFIDVGNDHRGLLHVDEMAWPEGAIAPSAFDCLKEDQTVEVISLTFCTLHTCSRCHFLRGQRQDIDTLCASSVFGLLVKACLSRFIISLLLSFSSTIHSVSISAYAKQSSQSGLLPLRASHLSCLLSHLVTQCFTCSVCL